MTTKGPPIPSEGPPVRKGGLLIPQHEAFCFFAILHLSFCSFGKRFCGSVKVVRFQNSGVAKFHPCPYGGAATGASVAPRASGARKTRVNGTIW